MRLSSVLLLKDKIFISPIRPIVQYRPIALIGSHRFILPSTRETNYIHCQQLRWISTDNNKGKDDIKYNISFKKGMDIKKVFKEFYSLYGPLFVGTHMFVSLTSLGFIYSLIWLTIDPVNYIPKFITEALGEKVLNIQGQGGNLILALALNKVILPFRLAGSVFLTKLIASKLKKSSKATKT